MTSKSTQPASRSIDSRAGARAGVREAAGPRGRPEQTHAREAGSRTRSHAPRLSPKGIRTSSSREEGLHSEYPGGRGRGERQGRAGSRNGNPTLDESLPGEGAAGTRFPSKEQTKARCARGGPWRPGSALRASRSRARPARRLSRRCPAGGTSRSPAWLRISRPHLARPPSTTKAIPFSAHREPLPLTSPASCFLENLCFAYSALACPPPP